MAKTKLRAGGNLPSSSGPKLEGISAIMPFISGAAQVQKQQQLMPLELQMALQKQQQMAPLELEQDRLKQQQSKQTDLQFLPQEMLIKAQAKKEEKIAEEEGNRAFGAMKEASSSKRFVQQFERSFDEIHKSVPGFDQSGIAGKLMRFGARGLNSLDMLPETKAFQVRLKPMANQMARDVEGGKITDQDRQIYADAFANTLLNPSETNARLISEQLIGLYDKGGDISRNLEAFAESKNPVLRMVHDQVTSQINGGSSSVKNRGISSVIPQKSSSQDTITMIAPDGSEHPVHRSNIQAAIKRGLKMPQGS